MCSGDIYLSNGQCMVNPGIDHDMDIGDVTAMEYMGEYVAR